MARTDKRIRRKVCRLCVDRVNTISLRDDRRLTRYVTDRGKLVPRRISGTCARHQRQLTRVLKQARVLALIPYTADQTR